MLFSDISVSLLAYTCGPTNVSKAIRRSEYSRSVYDLFDKLPAPGRDVVFALSASIILFENAEKLNLKIPNGEYSMDLDSTMVTKRLHLSQIQSVLDIPIEKLRYLNPFYKLDIIPAINENYPLNLPKGSLSGFNNHRDSIFRYNDSMLFDIKSTLILTNPVTTDGNTELVRKVKYYTVKRGDNLGKIAKKYHVSQRELMRWNNMKSPSQLKVGKKLKIITEETIVNKPSKKSDENPQNSTSEQGNNAKNTTPKTIDKSKTQYGYETQTIYHTVKKGENIGGISKKYKVSQSELMKWNNIRKPSDLQAGQKLKINKKIKVALPKTTDNTEKIDDSKISVTEHQTDSSNSVEIDSKKDSITNVNDKPVNPRNLVYYTVKKGETVSAISRKYPGTTPKNILDWNNMKNPNELKAGQKIKIYLNSEEKTTLPKEEIKNTTKPNTVPPKPKPEVKTTPSTVYHVVKSGETLSSISRKYNGVSVEEIMKWNKLSSPDKIALGQKLKIITK
jgi:membrane-bound lytic murein transglycosylase D